MHYQYYQPRYRSQSTLFQNPYAHVSVSHVSTPRQDYQMSSRLNSGHDSRLATASALRERLLTNIQQTIGEIDRELSALTPPSAIRRSVPVRVPPLHLNREVSQASSKTWPNKPKRVYKVVPSLPSGVRQISRQTSTTQLPDQPPLTHSTPKPSSSTEIFVVQSFIGQYHYGPEADEVAIAPRDPEDIEYSSVVAEMNEFSFDAVTSTQEFLREPSMLSEHRAVISVPQFVDYRHLADDEAAEDFLPPDFSGQIETMREKLTSPLHDFSAPSAIDVQNYSLLIRTAPEANLVNSMISKPVKHSRQTSNPSSSVDVPPTKAPTPVPKVETPPATNPRAAHFFSDFGVDGENGNEEEEEEIPIDPSNFTLPAEFERQSESRSGILLSSEESGTKFILVLFLHRRINKDRIEKISGKQKGRSAKKIFHIVESDIENQ